MVGSPGSHCGLSDHFALNQSPGKCAGNEDVVQPQMRIPNRKSVAFVRRMEETISVNVIRVFHELNSFALNVAAAEPDQPANPGGHTTNIENLAGRKRVKVANQNVKALLMSFDALQ